MNLGIDRTWKWETLEKYNKVKNKRKNAWKIRKYLNL